MTLGFETDPDEIARAQPRPLDMEALFPAWRVQMADVWDDLKHPRIPKGFPHGGEFISAGDASTTAEGTRFMALPDKADEYRGRDLHAEGEWSPKGGRRSAYGAVLFNDHGQVLLREPTNHYAGYHWQIGGKGGHEGDESPVDTALREAGEELGHKIQIVGHVPGGHTYGTKTDKLVYPSYQPKPYPDPNWKAPEPSAPAAPAFKPGDRVTEKNWGAGTVLNQDAKPGMSWVKFDKFPNKPAAIVHKSLRPESGTPAAEPADFHKPKKGQIFHQGDTVHITSPATGQQIEATVLSHQSPDKVKVKWGASIVTLHPKQITEVAPGQPGGEAATPPGPSRRLVKNYRDDAKPEWFQPGDYVQSWHGNTPGRVVKVNDSTVETQEGPDVFINEPRDLRHDLTKMDPTFTPTAPMIYPPPVRLPGPPKHVVSDETMNSNYYLARSLGEDPSLMDKETAQTKWVTPEEAAEMLSLSTNEEGRKRMLDTLNAATQEYNRLTEETPAQMAELILKFAWHYNPAEPRDPETGKWISGIAGFGMATLGKAFEEGDKVYVLDPKTGKLAEKTIKAPFAKQKPTYVQFQGELTTKNAKYVAHKEYVHALTPEQHMALADEEASKKKPDAKLVALHKGAAEITTAEPEAAAPEAPAVPEPSAPATKASDLAVNDLIENSNGEQAKVMKLYPSGEVIDAYHLTGPSAGEKHVLDNDDLLNDGWHKTGEMPAEEPEPAPVKMPWEQPPPTDTEPEPWGEPDIPVGEQQPAEMPEEPAAPPTFEAKKVVGEYGSGEAGDFTLGDKVSMQGVGGGWPDQTGTVTDLDDEGKPGIKFDDNPSHTVFVPPTMLKHNADPAPGYQPEPIPAAPAKKLVKDFDVAGKSTKTEDFEPGDHVVNVNGKKLLVVNTPPEKASKGVVNVLYQDGHYAGNVGGNYAYKLKHDPDFHPYDQEAPEAAVPEEVGGFKIGDKASDPDLGTGTVTAFTPHPFGGEPLLHVKWDSGEENDYVANNLDHVTDQPQMEPQELAGGLHAGDSVTTGSGNTFTVIGPGSTVDTLHVKGTLHGKAFETTTMPPGTFKNVAGTVPITSAAPEPEPVTPAAPEMLAGGFYVGDKVTTNSGTIWEVVGPGTDEGTLKIKGTTASGQTLNFESAKPESFSHIAKQGTFTSASGVSYQQQPDGGVSATVEPTVNGFKVGDKVHSDVQQSKTFTVTDVDPENNTFSIASTPGAVGQKIDSQYHSHWSKAGEAPPAAATPAAATGGLTENGGHHVGDVVIDSYSHKQIGTVIDAGQKAGDKLTVQWHTNAYGNPIEGVSTTSEYPQGILNASHGPAAANPVTWYGAASSKYQFAKGQHVRHKVSPGKFEKGIVVGHGGSAGVKVAFPDGNEKTVQMKTLMHDSTPEVGIAGYKNKAALLKQQQASGVTPTVAPKTVVNYGTGTLNDFKQGQYVMVKNAPAMGAATVVDKGSATVTVEFPGGVQQHVLPSALKHTGIAPGSSPNPPAAQTVPSPVAPKAAPPNTLPKDWATLSGYSAVPGPHGAKDGQWYEAPDGQKYYVKPDDATHAYNEVGGLAAYQAAGFTPGKDFPYTTVLQDENGQHYVVSQAIPGLTVPKSPQWWADHPEAKQKAQTMLAVHGLISHYDAVGANPAGGFDNLLVDAQGDPVMIEAGGGMAYSGLGTPKKAWNTTTPFMDELQGARGTGYPNPSMKAVFGTTTDLKMAQLLDQLQHVPNYAQKLADLWKQQGMPDSQIAANKAVIDHRMSEIPDMIKKLAPAGLGLQSIDPWENWSPTPPTPEETEAAKEVPFNTQVDPLGPFDQESLHKTENALLGSIPDSYAAITSLPTVTGPQTGSNSGTYYKDTQGHVFNVKKAPSLAYAQNAVAANTVYALAGGSVGGTIAPARVVQDGSDAYVVEQLPEGADTKSSEWWSQNPVSRGAMHNLWSVDTLLSNWNVAGDSLNKVLVSPDGIPIRMNIGGAMAFRQGGDVKPGWAPGKWVEPWTLRGKNHLGVTGNSGAKAIFGSMSDDEAADRLESLQGLNLTNLDAAWERAGIPAAKRQQDMAVIKSRLGQLKQVVTDLRLHKDMSGGYTSTSGYNAAAPETITGPPTPVAPKEQWIPVAQMMNTGKKVSSSMGHHAAQLLAAISDWAGSSGAARNSVLHGHPSAAAVSIYQAVDAAPANAPYLRRGFHPSWSPQKSMEEFAVGKTVDMNIMSTTQNNHTYQGFSGGGHSSSSMTSIVFHFPKGSRALRIIGNGGLSSEDEWISQGRFKVTKQEWTGGEGTGQLQVYLDQIGTFSMPPQGHTITASEQALIAGVMASGQVG